MTFRIATPPHNGKVAAMIDDAVRAGMKAWNTAAEEAAMVLVERVGAGRCSRAAPPGRGPELLLYVDGQLVYQQWWEWIGTCGHLRTRWVDGWEEIAR